MSTTRGECGECHICGSDTEIICDECSRFACSKIHSVRLMIDSKRYIDVCRYCQKKLKPGAKVAGVKITKRMIASKWHQARDVYT